MTYYRLRNIGDLPIVDDVASYSSEEAVFEEDGKFYIMESYTDIDYETRQGRVQVYKTKQEAWKVALKRLDQHISHMQKIREEAFHKALEDDTFAPDKEKALKFINNLKDTARDIASCADGDGYP